MSHPLVEPVEGGEHRSFDFGPDTVERLGTPGTHSH